MQVLLACVGIALRGAAFSVQGRGSKEGGGHGPGAGQWWGIAAMLGSALGYSTLGVLYDLLVRTEKPAPSHAEIMRYTSRLGANPPPLPSLVPTSWRHMTGYILVEQGFKRTILYTSLARSTAIYSQTTGMPTCK